MVSNSSLANLRDIHLPAPVSWWPLANGCYLLAVILLAIMSVLIIFIYRYLRNSRAKREALKLLAAYSRQYQQQGNSALICAQIAELLKRVALVYFPRQQAASLTGEQWLTFLNETSNNIDFFTVREYLLDLPYQKNKPNLDLNPLFKLAKNWLKQRRKPCFN